MWNIAFYILLIFSGSLDYAHKKFHRKASVSPVLNELKNSQQFTNKEREREREREGGASAESASLQIYCGQSVALPTGLYYINIKSIVVGVL